MTYNKKPCEVLHILSDVAVIRQNDKLLVVSVRDLKEETKKESKRK